ncbi:uncharacterized protein LOC143677561 [Tamandua tetradactyla]|uniref:uncharacterized protein LOC143677561 n=1 Tax=Tamandua tetradactyla TaxID=48850 RepID=UPI0040543C4E
MVLTMGDRLGTLHRVLFGITSPDYALQEVPRRAVQGCCSGSLMSSRVTLVPSLCSALPLYMCDSGQHGCCTSCQLPPPSRCSCQVALYESWLGRVFSYPGRFGMMGLLPLLFCTYCAVEKITGSKKLKFSRTQKRTESQERPPCALPYDRGSKDQGSPAANPKRPIFGKKALP